MVNDAFLQNFFINNVKKKFGLDERAIYLNLREDSDTQFLLNELNSVSMFSSKSILVLKKPIVTEKSTEMNQASKYVFEIDTRANKMDVKNAVQSAFNVTVLKVNIMNIKGKKNA